MLGIVVVLVAVIGGGWYFFLGKTSPVEMQDELADAMGKDGTVMTDNAVENPSVMPETDEHNEDAMMEVATSTPATTGGTAPVKSETAAPASSKTAKVFNITGKNFAFSETEMKVKKGDTVTVNFESTTGFHDWVVDEFKAKTQQVRPGTKTSVTFVADKAGTFEYYCSVGSHRAEGMTGKLIVE